MSLKYEPSLAQTPAKKAAGWQVIVVGSPASGKGTQCEKMSAKYGKSMRLKYEPASEPLHNPQPSTLNPQPSTLNPQPSTLNPTPSTLNPQPWTHTLNPSP